MPVNLPIILTWVRIAMIPLVISVYYVPEHMLSVPMRDALATGMFIFAAVTDWLDGWLARRLDQTSAFGAFLDPVADKLMVSAALLVLLNLGRIDAMIALIIIGREITISALREWMATLGERTSVAVHWLGKFKTVAQMTAIPCLLYGGTVAGFNALWWGSRLIEIAAVLTVWSMMYYLRRAWPIIKRSA
ncbi:CDP-diacylglycerol--glycerol-3-phosphate 3-phosphatidyltransferase [Pigmentiphaga humi]|uniref:CDP-diacylglycerol--glycerol-3-phosphate 3-phosphatidyltransferase n=1 Tax=Pigmentiphaga humi TaxID=2478468 RepID=A0A3P4B729_9BURK|nr:CDP-diacylglycerol--glycerol-3-phosphate 3-phosphatidyltransferase [Pigmentiphaga humi]VCU72093.1 CDP-diacylglycerol--glycerol-3-phosphate 3-phosphatidyltransferase [Pigmentiphaga humi]